MALHIKTTVYSLPSTIQRIPKIHVEQRTFLGLYAQWQMTFIPETGGFLLNNWSIPAIFKKREISVNFLC